MTNGEISVDKYIEKPILVMVLEYKKYQFSSQISDPALVSFTPICKQSPRHEYVPVPRNATST